MRLVFTGSRLLSGDGLMLELRSVSKIFGELSALHQIDLLFPPGKVSGLIGPNGSGKTTLVNIITGIYAPDTGQILFNGVDIAGVTADRVSRFGVARTFQNIRIFSRMTVLENVLAASISLNNPSWVTLLGYAKGGNDPRLDMAYKALETVDLLNEADVVAGKLPLPLRRRLEIARAFVRNPELLFLDEPAGGMTPAETANVASLIRERIAPGRTCIVIEHKMDLISDVCQHLCVLNHGEKIAEGPPGIVLEQPQVIEAYLGRD